MSYLKIKSLDVSALVQSLRIGYETLVSEDSGRNANGDLVIDVINKKVKLYVTFRPMDGDDMSGLMSLISDYVFNITFRDSETNSEKTITCYTSTPEPEYYWIHDNQVLYKPLSINFIEL